MLTSCKKAGNPVTPYLQNERAAVFVFLAPDCPLSQTYTLTLNGLAKEAAGSGIRFYGVFSSEGLPQKAIDDFAATYKLTFETVPDPRMTLADFFHAAVTPEVFVVNSKGETIYKGAIDNGAPELGQHRTVVTEHYLKDALDSVRENMPVRVKETQGTGCFIERKSPD